MKKSIILSVIFISLIFSTYAQPSITQSDMPNIGDTLRIKVPITTNGDDYASSGTNHTWNFSNLVSASQRVDTFMSVASTSLVYMYYFQLLSGCNLAGNQPNFLSFSAPLGLGLSITNVYDFFDKSNASYAQLGYGAQFNGIPLPIKYSSPDVQLVFPLTYGEKDSCSFSDSTHIPSLGYYRERKHRVNKVDGWGTVIVPNDTFQAIRVVSVITAHDSIHVDTLINMGFNLNSVTTEYKWYADNMGEPVLKVSVVTGTGAGTTIEYRNRIKSNAGIKDINANIASAGLYPNPANENTNLYFSLEKAANIEINITDMLGRNIKTIANKQYPAGFNIIPIDISQMQLDKGIYFVRINSGSNSKVIKLQVL